MLSVPELEIQQTWQQLRDAVSNAQHVSAITLVVYLLAGGLLSIYIRWLYRRYGASPMDADSVTRVFPLLTLVTIAVIAVVKSSMALSLGLVGALSIVRFRAAIKEPEELVYLFLCIGVGLGLGAGQPLLVVALVLVSTVFIAGMHSWGRGYHDQRLLLTVAGPSSRFAEGNDNVFHAIRQACGVHRIQRFDVDAQRGQIRICLRQSKLDQSANWMPRLRAQLPDCEISLVDLGTLG